MPGEPDEIDDDRELEELERILADEPSDVPEVAAEVIEDAASRIEREVAAELAELEQGALRDQAELGGCVAKILELTDPDKQLSARVKLSETRKLAERIDSWLQNGQWP